MVSCEPDESFPLSCLIHASQWPYWCGVDGNSSTISKMKYLLRCPEPTLLWSRWNSVHLRLSGVVWPHLGAQGTADNHKELTDNASFFVIFQASLFKHWAFSKTGLSKGKLQWGSVSCGTGWLTRLRGFSRTPHWQEKSGRSPSRLGRGKSETVAVTHPEQADQSSHITETAQSRPFRDITAPCQLETQRASRPPEGSGASLLGRLQPAAGGDVAGSALRCSAALPASFPVDPQCPWREQVLLVMLVMNSRWEQINERVRNCRETILRFINTTMKMPVKLWYKYTHALKKLFFLLMREEFKITSFCLEQLCQGKIS